MAANSDQSWSSIIRSAEYQDKMEEDTAEESLPLNFIKPVMLDESQKYHRDLEAVPLTYKCINCHLQVNNSLPNYPPELSDTTSLMSGITRDPTPPPPSPPSPLQVKPPELCLSPLQDPLYVGIHRNTPYMTHPAGYVCSEDQDQDGPNSPLPAIGVCSNPRPIQMPKYTKNPTETCSIETSTQTERELLDYAELASPVPPPPPPPAMRSDSRASLSSTMVGELCRICHCESEPEAPLISPCVCCGSLKYVHQSCLQQWIKSADTKSCELCRFDFEMTTRIKPFRKWQKLEMTTVERRKIMCSVTFHIIAITCVIWSLYVLIDRTTEEIKHGILEWPFWTKLIVVAIGFTGGLVFMYVQCKMYVQLCRRWRAYNRVIYIQNCPNLTGQKIPLQPHMLDENGKPKKKTTSAQTPGIVIQETELL